jgi:GTP-binding protein Era
VKSGFVAVAGRPNVGKSTLVNALCGEKVAITSTVPNTTRRRIFGVAHGADYQLALVDLPGFQRPMDALTERMQQTVDSSFEDVDAVLLVVDARAHIGSGDRFVARRVFGLGKPVVIGGFHALHPVSAKTKEGVGELRGDLVLLLPEGPAYFPDTQATDLAPVERIAEIVREKALHLTRDEVPHAITVEVDELEDGRVHAVIYVETESQKGILVGKKGAMVREIGTRARPEVEALVGGRVFLELQVKVRPKWRRDPRMLERLGL